MVPFERALVSSYRPYIVTFHLSLRLSEILPLLCSSTPLFPTPKFPHVPLGVGEPLLGSKERRCRSLSVQLGSKIFNLCDPDPSTLQTDRQTTCYRNTALCTKVHRTVKQEARLPQRDSASATHVFLGSLTDRTLH